MTQFENFKKTLEELFMLDQAELDFGIYRIMNQKRSEINRYLNTDLVRHVRQVLEPMAQRHEVSLATLVYAWLLYHPAGALPISGSR